ncbi:MAG: hypothetical protein GY772_30735 [bacterium]|nr:hypothetical protein [bacterium]
MTTMSQTAPRDVKVVFCTATLKRTYQLEKALPINLLLSWGCRREVAWVLADFNEDLEVQQFLAEHCQLALRAGLLRYFRMPENAAPFFWHAPIAKNACHMCAVEAFGQDVLLCNWDGDNIVTPNFVRDLVARAPPIVRKPPSAIGVSYRHPRAPSTTGRIACAAHTFVKLGGYDQDLLKLRVWW